MFNKKAFGALLTITLVLTGCVSAPRPEEVCTANWIKPRTDAALTEFRSATSESWDSLQKTAKRTAKSGELGIIERASVLLTLTRLASSFKNSQALSDLQTLGRTCNDPNLVRNALVGALEDYDVPQPYINLLNELDAFVQLFEESAAGLK